MIIIKRINFTLTLLCALAISSNTYAYTEKDLEKVATISAIADAGVQLGAHGLSGYKLSQMNNVGEGIGSLGVKSLNLIENLGHLIPAIVQARRNQNVGALLQILQQGRGNFNSAKRKSRGACSRAG